jgi:predicted Na+-dependent transporter
MTAISSVVALAVMPLNLWFWLTKVLKVPAGVVGAADLGGSLGIVILGASLGVFTNKMRPGWANFMNFMGTISGVGLMLFSALATGRRKEPEGPNEEERHIPFRVLLACFFPFFLGLLFTLALSTWVVRLERPQRVALGIEACYQNTGIALAFGMQTSHPVSKAGLVIPLLCGGMQVSIIAAMVLVAWKANWTLAPPSDPFWKVFGSSYQRKDQRMAHSFCWSESEKPSSMRNLESRTGSLSSSVGQSQAPASVELSSSQAMIDNRGSDDG